MAGQSVCSGCGSDVISCCCEWLFTNSTLVPGGTTSSTGLTDPPVPIVMRNALSGVGEGELGVLLPPPQPDPSSAALITADSRTRNLERDAGTDGDRTIPDGDLVAGVAVDVQEAVGIAPVQH